ncbi:putative RDD family membrane protein YckC [Actinocorallia herbida]|uniref:Putative RDD family membrane protein YckC n=1 Tax=Actinocorallia herbida TaxID=58109 RepID=A0A3N1DBV9_9ACTN|nr:RDD family protein [Actinocorallia herbida]ROO90956.1 putative RDD family membrane protein YckC [Actinocorallia herbida]
MGTPPPYDPYGQQQPGYGQQQQPGYGQQYPPQQPPAYQATPPPAYPAQPAFPAAAQPPQHGVPQQRYGYAGGAIGDYAHWGSRVAAYIVDGLIVGLIPAIFYGIGIGLSAGTTTIDEYGNVSSSGGSAAGTLLILVGAVIAIAGGLWLVYQEGTTGQTIGKKLVNIRLISEQTSQPIGFGMAFVRKIAHILDGFCYIGFLWPLFDAKKQTFADKVMSTVVVRSH